MFTLGSIVFVTPWILSALVLLPIIWWLLRLTPPAPKRIDFPAARFLFDLNKKEESAAKTPWWLLLLRLLIAALIIVALAQPVLNPQETVTGSNDILVVVDNGWESAKNWAQKKSTLMTILNQAERQKRTVSLLTTARSENDEAPKLAGPMPASEAKSLADRLQPQSWPVDFKGAADSLKNAKISAIDTVFWLHDGVKHLSDDVLLAQLQRMSGLNIFVPEQKSLPVLLLPPEDESGALTLRALRTDNAVLDQYYLQGISADGRVLLHQSFSFDGKAEASITIDPPADVRNQIARLAIENEQTAGATVLLDNRYRHYPVGLVSGEKQVEAQPILNDLHYLEKALEPFSEVRKGEIADLVKSKIAVLVLSDIGALNDGDQALLEDWVKKGGVLLRFAGPRFAQNAETFLPVPLRLGDRALGGVISWEQPVHLAAFPKNSPFAGLSVPPDVTVTRQVLAEPSPDLAEHSWATLDDGTPLITAKAEGAGWIVLVHTTASPDWSNLSLSGLFVEMLRRITALSAGVADAEQRLSLQPVSVLDGFARLRDPSPVVKTINPAEVGVVKISPQNPAGYYGSRDAKRALNLGQFVRTLAAFEAPAEITTQFYGSAKNETPLKPILFGIAFALFLVDFVISLLLRGLLPLRRLAVLVLLLLPIQAHADNQQAIERTTKNYLGYVVTHDAQADAVSAAGLDRLVKVVGTRTTIELAGAQPVNLDNDELAFFPLLYWPVSAQQPVLSFPVMAKVNNYLRQGGMIVFDGRGGDPRLMQVLARGLNLPALTPLSPEHVLRKSFYLLRDFPGRLGGSEIWVEADEDQLKDGVSSVIVVGQDWASLWAQTDDSYLMGVPYSQLNTEEMLEKEFSLRFGVNLVMYALAGNYKSDQIHLPMIMERLSK